MFSIKCNILYIVIFNVLAQIQSLVELPPREDTGIAVTELAIRNTINSLFYTLKLDYMKRKSKLKSFSTIHNIFAYITLQDNHNLKEIATLTKVANIDNTTIFFITQINDVLNEDSPVYEATDDVYVSTYIEAFIRKLEYLKYKHDLRSNVGNFDINTKVFNHLNIIKSDSWNGTQIIKNPNDSNQNLLSDNEFWQPNNRRVFEADRVRIDRFPFMASIQFFKKFQCGGSIIKSDLVITSASCLQLAWNSRFFRENPNFLSVQVGCNLFEGGTENIPVVEVHFHPEYNPKNLVNNLSLLRLRRILNFGKRAKKIKKIDFDRDPWPLPHTTRGITIVGWGARTTSNIISDPWSNQLGFAVLDFYPLKECEEIYSKEYVTYKNFCAGFFSKGGGACHRDVGGPGVVNGILVGVVSFGSPNCGAPNAPTVFTKLGYYKDWIDEIMGQDVSSGGAKTTEKPIRLAPEIKIEVFTKSSIPIEIEPIDDLKTTTKSTPVHIREDLRTADENTLFKEFMATMFGSEAVKKYIDRNETGTEPNSELKELDEIFEIPASTNETTTAKVISTTKPTKKTTKYIESTTFSENHFSGVMPAINYEPNGEQVESIRMVTTMEKYNKLERQKQAIRNPDAIMKDTVSNVNKEDDKNLESNIAKLINNIDIQELLKYEPSIEVSNVKKDKEDNRMTTQDGLEMYESEMNEEKKNEESSSEDEESDSDYSSINVTDNIKNENIGKEQLNVGLSIPIEPFKDLTFRQNASDILNSLSDADLMDLLKQAALRAHHLNN